MNKGVPDSPDYVAESEYFNPVIDIAGGMWDTDTMNYTTPYFTYQTPACGGTGCWVDIFPTHNKYALQAGILKSTNSPVHNCYTNETDLGRYICKSLQNQGWAYKEDTLELAE